MEPLVTFALIIVPLLKLGIPDFKHLIFGGVYKSFFLGYSKTQTGPSKERVALIV